MFIPSLKIQHIPRITISFQEFVYPEDFPFLVVFLDECFIPKSSSFK